MQKGCNAGCKPLNRVRLNMYILYRNIIIGLYIIYYIIFTCIQCTKYRAGNRRVDFEKRLCCFPAHSLPPRANRSVAQRRYYIIICTQQYSTGYASAWTWSKPVAAPHWVLWHLSLSISLSLRKKFKSTPRNDDCLIMINYYFVLLQPVRNYIVLYGRVAG